MSPELKAKSDAAFEAAWQSDWQAKVEGNFFSRRWEPTIKAAAKAVWDHAVEWVIDSKVLIQYPPAG